MMNAGDECKFSFWYSEVSAYYVYNLVYLCRSLLEQQIKLVLNAIFFYIFAHNFLTISAML